MQRDLFGCCGCQESGGVGAECATHFVAEPQMVEDPDRLDCIRGRDLGVVDLKQVVAVLLLAGGGEVA